MALTLAWTAHSEVGLVRKNNQDSAYVSPTMVMVADGMGGAAAGDLASAVAIDELRRTDETLAERLGDAAAGASDVLAILAGALQRANDRLNDLIDGDPQLDGMGTTVCGFVLHDDALAVVNIGDSRAYRVRDGDLSRLTHDHSWVHTLVDEGRISEAEALEHPHRSLVLRVLNGNPAHQPDLAWEDLRAGDRILVCSDGLCGLVTDAEIAAVATLPDRDVAARGLVELAHEAGGHDNITFVLADAVVDGPPGTPAVLGSAVTVRIPASEHTAQLPSVAVPQEGSAANERAFTEKDRYALAGRRRPLTRLKLGLTLFLPLLALAGAALGWYGYTQTRYYVGAQSDLVAVFQGVPDRLLGLQLSHVVETDTTRVTDLPPYFAERVRATIAVDSLGNARATVGELRAKAAQCIAQREARTRATAAPVTPTPDPTALPTPDPTVDPTALTTPDPATTASPTPGATAGVTPSPTTLPTVTSPEEC